MVVTRKNRLRKNMMTSKNTKISSESIKNWAQIIAIFGAGFWAFVTFVFLPVFEQYIYRPHLVLSSSLEKVGKKDKLIILNAKISVTNKSKAKVYALASSYNIFALN